jgi:replicative DNA helicase
LNDDEVWEWIAMWNERNKPPIDVHELRKTFESIKRGESRSKPHKMEIESFLDTPDRVVKEYDENYIRIAFGGSNLKRLERKMNGGLIGGRLYILGGIPASGKTVFCVNAMIMINHFILTLLHSFISAAGWQRR